MGLNLFGRKSDNLVENVEEEQTVVAVEKRQKGDVESNEKGDMAKDLMVLIGHAIDEWARQYHMQNLPNHIVFEQALAIMNAWDDIFNDRK